MLNHVTIIGRITHDLELKTTQSGVSCITFSIACDEDYKPKDGGERAVDFIRVKAWQHTAEFVNSYFSKGRAIVVSGRLKADNYTDKDGNKRTDTYVSAKDVYFADSKRSDGAGSSNATYTAPAAQGDSAADFAALESDDSDLPF